MRIGDLAKQLGVTPKTLRHYERIGLLGHPSREYNNYRVYDDESVERIRIIVGLRALGLPLDRIREVLTDAGTRREKLAEWLDRETQELSIQIAVLQGRHEDLEARLEALMQPAGRGRGGPQDCICPALMKPCACTADSQADEGGRTRRAGVDPAPRADSRVTSEAI